MHRILSTSVFLLASLSVAPSKSPPAPSINVPCEVIEWYDGDTGTVRVTLDLRVRLLDCWAPEVRTHDAKEKLRGIAAREHLKRQFPEGKSGVLEIPLHGERFDDVITMGRVLGNVWIDGKSVSEAQVKAGHATPLKAAE